MHIRPFASTEAQNKIKHLQPSLLRIPIKNDKKSQSIEDIIISLTEAGFDPNLVFEAYQTLKTDDVNLLTEYCLKHADSKTTNTDQE